MQEKRKYCEEYGLDFKNLLEVSKKEFDIIETLVNENEMRPELYQNLAWSEDEKTMAIKLVIFGAFYPNYFLSNPKDEMDVRKEAGCEVCPYSSVVFGGLSFVDRPEQYADQVSERGG